LLALPPLTGKRFDCIHAKETNANDFELAVKRVKRGRTLRGIELDLGGAVTLWRSHIPRQ